MTLIGNYSTNGYRYSFLALENGLGFITSGHNSLQRYDYNGIPQSECDVQGQGELRCVSLGNLLGSDETIVCIAPDPELDHLTSYRIKSDGVIELLSANQTLKSCNNNNMFSSSYAVDASRSIFYEVCSGRVIGRTVNAIEISDRFLWNSPFNGTSPKIMSGDNEVLYVTFNSAEGAVLYALNTTFAQPSIMWSKEWTNSSEHEVYMALGKFSGNHTAIYVVIDEFSKDDRWFNGTRRLLFALDGNGVEKWSKTVSFTGPVHLPFKQPQVFRCGHPKLCAPDSLLVAVSMDATSSNQVNLYLDAASATSSSVFSTIELSTLTFVDYGMIPISVNNLPSKIVSKMQKNGDPWSSLTVFGCGVHQNGHLCSQCDPGYFYDDNSCLKCPDSVIGALIALFFGAIGVVAVMGVLSKLKIGRIDVTVPFIQMVGFIQFTALLLVIDIEWPISLTNLFQFFKILNFSVDSLGLQCEFDLTFGDRLLLTLITPLLIIGIMLFGLSILYVLTKLDKFKMETLKKMLIAMLRGIISLIKILFLPLTVKSMKIFDCIALGSSYLLQGNPDIECYTPEWTPLAIMASIMLFLYTALPILLMLGGYFLRHFRKFTDTESVFGQVFGSVVSAYRYDASLYEVAVLMRKVVVPVLIVLLAVARAPLLAGFISFLWAFIMALITLPFATLRHNLVEVTTLLCTSLQYAVSFFISEHATLEPLLIGFSIIGTGVSVIVLGCEIGIGIKAKLKGEKGDDDTDETSEFNGWLRSRSTWGKNKMVKGASIKHWAIPLLSLMTMISPFSVLSVTIRKTSNISDTILTGAIGESGASAIGIGGFACLSVFPTGNLVIIFASYFYRKCANDAAIIGRPTLRWIGAIVLIAPVLAQMYGGVVMVILGQRNQDSLLPVFTAAGLVSLGMSWIASPFVILDLHAVFKQIRKAVEESGEMALKRMSKKLGGNEAAK